MATETGRDRLPAADAVAVAVVAVVVFGSAWAVLTWASSMYDGAARLLAALLAMWATAKYLRSPRCRRRGRNWLRRWLRFPFAARRRRR